MTVVSEPEGAGRGSRAVSRAVVPFVPKTSARPSLLRMEVGLWLAGLALALGLGTFGVHTLQTSLSAARSAQSEATAQTIRRLQDEVAHLRGGIETMRTAEAARQDETARTLKRSVDALKQEVEQVRSADGASLAQLSTKLDRTDHDPNPRLAEIVARLDKLDHETAVKPAETATRMADLTSRLDRMERQVSAPATTGSIPAPSSRNNAAGTVRAVAAPGSKGDTTAVPQTADARMPSAKPPTLDAWVVREVYDGIALVEARRGGLREVEPGQFLPGAGEVRSIERRGREWVVLTSRGIIETSTF